MSEASMDRDDRPAEVTDPLLWRLAAAVADAHQPDEDVACGNPSCVGASWPCAAWGRAQDGLQAALTTPRPTPAADQDHKDRLTGSSSRLLAAASLPTQPQPARAPLAITSAA